MIEILTGILFGGVFLGIVVPTIQRTARTRLEVTPELLPFIAEDLLIYSEEPKIRVKPLNSFLKRMCDITSAFFGLAVLSPVLILISLLIKIDSRGPVFYIQKRVGLNRRRKPRTKNESSFCENIEPIDSKSEGFGRIFNLIKFRTMVHDAEKTCGPVWATKNDPRITAVGRFLRKTRLDEIPQLFNVLKGDMSLVGPRPERQFFVRDFIKKIPNYENRLLIKPGITGLAQINNGYDDSIESVVRKLRYDIDYIDNWSIWMDFRILLKTIAVVFGRKGAH